MAQVWTVGCITHLLALGLLGGAIAPPALTLALPFSSAAIAQIAPDSTLGNERSQVIPNRNIRGLPGILIQGGARRGSNLFQSFSEFNVGEGQRVYFANPNGISTILSRVTGRNPSNILGTLGVAGTANLFLLNPNGILFGANARLDIAGSFVASTADSLEFGNGLTFSATNPEAAPMLTVSLNPGLQYGTAYRGTISNAGNLSVGNGQTLALAGHTVTQTGSLTAPGGTVQVLGNAIALLDHARIDVSGIGGGGTVQIGGNFQGKGSLPNASDVQIGAHVTINADGLSAPAHTTPANGGQVVVWSNGSTQFEGTISARGGNRGGNGGSVEVSGKQTLVFNGQVNTTALNGNPGRLLLDPYDLVISQPMTSASELTLQADHNITINAPIAITSVGAGLFATAGNTIAVNNDITTNGGFVKLTAIAGDLSITGADITTSSDIGFAGSVNFSAGNQTSLVNTNLDARSVSGSTSDFTTIKISGRSVLIDKTYISTTNSGSGYAGDIAISALDSVEIRDSRGIDTSTSPGIFSQGRLGRILIGQSDYFTYSPTSVVIDNAQLVTNNRNDADAGTQINAGGIDIRANQSVALDNEAILTSSTFRNGDAGIITIAASELVSLSNQSRIYTTAAASATGNAGGVGIVAGDLLILGKSSISSSTYATNSTVNSSSTFDDASTSGGSSAGAVILQIKNDAELDDSNIFNNLEHGASGAAGIVLLTAQSLSLSNGAQIQTIVRGDQGGAAASGNAGNVLIGVNGTVKVIGQNDEGFPSAIFSTVEKGASGVAGNVLIEGRDRDRATSVQIRDNGTINVRNLGAAATDQAGNVFIAARGIWLDNDANIAAISSSGQGGNILLDTDALILGRSSEIQATAGVLGTEGSGGNIAIGRGNSRSVLVTRRDNTQVQALAFDDLTLLVAGKTLRDNNILAQAFSGTGGNIRINAFDLQGIRERPDLSTRNDISTESFAGVNGTTVVNTLNIFPSFRSDPLPERYQTPAISESCDPRVRQETSKFTVTGRGGVPSNPAEVLNQDTLSGTSSSQYPGLPQSSASPASETASPRATDRDEIVPAQGWMRNVDGTIRLTAYATNHSLPLPNPFWSNPAPCSAP